MKIIITKEAAGMLNTLFRVQDVLPIKEAGIAEHYKLSDEIGGRDYVKIQRWIRTQRPAWMDAYYALKDGLEGKEPLSDEDLDLEEPTNVVADGTPS